MIYDAKYHDDVDPQFNNNPLITSLPPQKKHDDFIKWAIQKPNYSPNERNLDSQTRITRISSLKYKFFIPNGRHYQLYLNMYTILENGYRWRSPLKKEYIELISNDYDNLDSSQENNLNNLCITPFGFSLIGVSGVGKTTAVNLVLRSLPPALKHNIEGHNIFYQVLYVRIECPKDGSLKQFCKEFFVEIDKILLTDYSEKYKSKNYTLTELVRKMEKIAISNNVGCLIVDEIQSLSSEKAGGKEALLDFFVGLNNKLMIPIVLIGTPQSLTFLQHNLRRARRSGESGAYKWDRLSQGREWSIFIKAMWRYQWTKKEFPFNDDFDNIMYYHSQGVIDYAIRLFMRSQIRAIVNGKETIDKNLIQQVVDDEMWLEKPMMETLRSNDKRTQLVYDDIYFPDEDPIMLVDNEDNTPLKLKNIISNLKLLNIPKEKATRYAELYLEKYPEEETPNLILKILLAIQEEDNRNEVLSKPKRKREKLTIRYNEDDLRQFSKSKEIHEELKSAGIIKDPLIDFLS